jgi:HEAT repeat protein
MAAENVKAPRNDPQPTQDLIARYLEGPDEDTAWDAVRALQLRGTDEVLEAACTLGQSSCLQERALGAHILGQLGSPERSFPEECLAILSQWLEKESQPEVLAAICCALGHLRDPRSIEPLIRFKNHQDDRVRFDVTFALCGHDDERAIAALIELSRDSDAKVRDWATFGLSTMSNLDSPAIRRALWERLADPDEQTRAEGLIGLARRKDRQILEPLLRELTAEKVHTLAIEAAAELGDPEAYLALVALKERGVESPDLEDALARCQPTAGEVRP